MSLSGVAASPGSKPEPTGSFAGVAGGPGQAAGNAAAHGPLPRQHRGGRRQALACTLNPKAVLQESLVDLDKRLDTPLRMDRFRANIAVAGDKPWPVP